MIYLTGDTHGRFDRIGAFCDTPNCTHCKTIGILQNDSRELY